MVGREDVSHRERRLAPVSVLVNPSYTHGASEGSRSLLPPDLKTIDEYRLRYTDADYWRPYVAGVYRRHGLGPIESIRSGHPGTNAVFIVNDTLAVKFDTPFVRSGCYAGGSSYPKEVGVYGLIARDDRLPTPGSSEPFSPPTVRALACETGGR